MAGRQVEVRRVPTLNVTTVVEPRIAFRPGSLFVKRIMSLVSTSLRHLLYQIPEDGEILGFGGDRSYHCGVP